MGIPVKLPVFEGPLDLLLHLIDKNKIDIYDIPIVEITNSTWNISGQMEREDLNVMSEFLVDGGDSSGYQMQNASSKRSQRRRRGRRSETGAG